MIAGGDRPLYTHVQIINRQEGQAAIHEEFGPGDPQISYNSDGRLVIRLIRSRVADILVVLSPRVSRALIQFCQTALARVEPFQSNVRDTSPF